MAFSLRILIASLAALGKTDEAVAVGQQLLWCTRVSGWNAMQGCVRSEAMRWWRGSAGCGRRGCRSELRNIAPRCEPGHRAQLKRSNKRLIRCRPAPNRLRCAAGYQRGNTAYGSQYCQYRQYGEHCECRKCWQRRRKCWRMDIRQSRESAVRARSSNAVAPRSASARSIRTEDGMPTGMRRRSWRNSPARSGRA